MASNAMGIEKRNDFITGGTTYGLEKEENVMCDKSVRTVHGE